MGEKIKRHGMYVYGRWAAQAAIQTARYLITVSEYAKRTIVDRFYLEPQRVIVIPNGLAKKFRPLGEKDLHPIREKFGLRKDFILGITSASPRKNAAGLLDAYQALEPALQEKFDLVLVWTHGLWKKQLTQLLQIKGISHRVQFIENAHDDDLVGLMNLAGAFVFPSLEEGFGLPPLEAMACGTPVIASNRSSLPEILGDAAVLIDPTDVSAMAQAIRGILKNDHLAREYGRRGQSWAARYTWSQCAQATLQVYQEARLAG
jgi:alpha-1,3-rhamnosyl/mannosyltransferase